MSDVAGLADFVCGDLDILSIGINPSLHSVASGYPFSSPRNRFWPAFNQSRLVEYIVEPSPAALEALMTRDKIGFTDIVKRPTRGISDLKAGDYRQGAQELHQKLLVHRPYIAWFQGMTAARYFYRYTETNQQREPQWGLQPQGDFPFLVFVSPNPSPANAAFSLADLVAYFNELAELRASQRGK